MIRKAVNRAAVWTVGAGLIAAPMSLMGPQLALVACQNPGGQYPQGINSQTTLQLDDTVGQYGEPNRATSTVSSNQGTPEGQVRFFVNGNRYASRIVDNDGTVSVPLARGLKARRTHDVQARFVSDCPWNNSRSPKRYYSVQRAATNTDPQVRNGQKSRFAATVDRVGEGDGFHPQNGKMRFTVRREGSNKVIRGARVPVRNAFAFADMRNLRPGSYTITSRYLGSNNFLADSTRESFTVI